MATYVNDLRLKEIATGDESGTWGTSTNTNLELIANAMGVGAEAIANASTHTITMADGTADEFRSTFLRLTGGGQACTVTLAPNTLSHTWIMRNETAAALTLTQGSGANVVIAAGQTKIVATDGAGSGAIVYEMDDLELAGNLAVDGAITSSSGATITVADNSNNLTLTSTDGDANAGPNLDLYRNSTGPADGDLVGRINFRGRNDNSQDVDYAAWVSRISDASDGSEDGILRADIIAAGAVVDVLTLYGTEVVVNESSADVDFRVESDNSTHALFVQGSDGNVGIGNSSPSERLVVSDSDGGTIAAFTDSTSADLLIKCGSSVSTITPTTGILALGTSSTERIRIDSSGNVLVGTTASGSAGLNVGNSINIGFSEGANTSIANIFRQSSSAATVLASGYKVTGTANKYASSYASSWAKTAVACHYGGIRFFADAAATVAVGTDITPTERMRITESGKVGIGEASPAATLHLDSTGVTAIAFDSDAGTQQYEMGTGYAGVGSANNFYLYNNTASSAALIVDTSGNLLVGTTSHLLNSKANFVRSNTTSSAIVINAYNSAATSTSRATNSIFRGATQGNGADVHLVLTDSVANNYYFGGNQAGTWVATNTNGVRLSNGGTSWASDSDERLKDIIEPIENGLEKVLTLRSVIGKYKTDEEDKRRVFLIAQDVQAVLPEAVFENEGNLMLQYTDLIPLLVAATKEQQAIIESQAAAITDLTTRLTALENN